MESDHLPYNGAPLIQSTDQLITVFKDKRKKHRLALGLLAPRLTPNYPVKLINGTIHTPDFTAIFAECYLLYYAWASGAPISLSFYRVWLTFNNTRVFMTPRAKELYVLSNSGARFCAANPSGSYNWTPSKEHGPYRSYTDMLRFHDIASINWLTLPPADTPIHEL